MTVKVEIIADTLPEYQTNGAAGMDVCASESVVVYSGRTALVKTGIRVAVPEGFELQVRPRSGLSLKHGITVLNTPGTIDSDYRGEIGVILHNTGGYPFAVKAGDRIAQLVLCPVARCEWVKVEALSDTARGEGGFGSTAV